MGNPSQPTVPPLSITLLGTWKLVSRIDVTQDGRRCIDPSLGEDPIAILYYDRSGNFAAQFMKRDRSGQVVDATSSGQNNSRAQGGYDAYFGSYSIDDALGTVTQRLFGSLSNENVGMVLTRGMTVEGDKLTIQLQTTSALSEPVTRTLIWERVG